MSVFTGRWREHTLHISLIPSRFSITLEEGGRSEVYNFDYEGRPWNLFIDEVTYQRGLNGKIVAKWIDPQTGRGRRWLEPEEARALEQKAGTIAGELSRAIAIGEAVLPGDLPHTLGAHLQQAESFAREHVESDIRTYFKVYKPIGILPPDQYLAVVLQATEGCSFNTCTFCSFYRDRPFRVKSGEEFRAHAYAVRAYLGDGLSLRRTIFLGDANALAAPTQRLLTLMETTREIFDVDRLGGVFAFLDGFSGERKSISDYAALREMGLERVYIGLESGHEPLLRFLNKPGRAKDALDAVRKIKSAGVAVGVIVLLGAGGGKFASGHVRDTIHILNAMKLDRYDQIYFSELIEHEGLDYLKDAYQKELKPLTPEERLAQGEYIEGNLRFDRRRGTPQLSRYDIREFVY